MCGFNAHHQLACDSNGDIPRLVKCCRSPNLKVRCALWSSTVIEDDRILMHHGFRITGLDPISIEGPPTRNVKTIFGDTGGVLGALTMDGRLLVYHDNGDAGQGPELKKHYFDEDSFIETQNLAIEHLAITDNGEVCVVTSRSRRLSGYAFTYLR